MSSQGGRVSVICLTWNHLDYTKKAVESIRSELHADDEVIFVDNFSTDGTLEYLNEFARSLSGKIKVLILFPLAPCGIGKAYNMAFAAAKCDYIFIFDNDLEIVMPGTLDHMLKTFQDFPSTGIVCPCCNNIIGRIRACASVDKLPNDIQEITLGYKKWWPECPSAAWLIKKEVLDKIGGWDEQFDPYGIADYDFARRAILAGYTIMCDRFIFVQHYGSITASGYVNVELLQATREKFYKKWAGDVNYPTGGTPPAPRRQ